MLYFQGQILLKRGDDTDKVRFEFCCKMIINQFCCKMCVAL